MPFGGYWVDRYSWINKSHCTFVCSWGNTFPIGSSMGGMRVQRQIRGQNASALKPGQPQWTFGKSRNTLPLTTASHIPLARNSSPSSPYLQKPSMFEVIYLWIYVSVCMYVYSPYIKLYERILSDWPGTGLVYCRSALHLRCWKKNVSLICNFL